LKYIQSRIITTNENSKNYCVEFLKTLDETLKFHDFKTKVSSTSIEFEKTFRSTTNYGDNVREAMKILRTGKIDLLIKSNKVIVIKRTIDLSHLAFMTIFSGLLIFLFGWFLEYKFIGIGIFSVISMIIIYFIGWVKVNDRINKIIEIAKEKT